MIDERLIAFGVVVLIVGSGWAWLLWSTHRTRRRGAMDLLAGPDGRPLVLAFSAPDCAPCRTLQRPELVELQRRHAGRVLVRDVDAVAEAGLSRRFGIITVPSTVVIGEDGHIRAINRGVAPWQRLASQIGLDGNEDSATR